MKAALWLYLQCVASFGIYACVWVRRAAIEVAGVDRGLATAWSLGLLVPPVGGAVLYALAREMPRGPGAALAGTAPWIAPILHTAVFALWMVPELRGLWSPFWLLLPIPVCVVAALLERAPSPAPVPASAGRRVVAALAVAIGLPLVGFATWSLEGTTLGLIGVASPDSIVAGPEDRYRVALPERGWIRVPSGTIAGEDSDLELMTHDRASFVVVYSHSSSRSLDDLVDERRALIFDGVAVKGFEERRFFADAETSQVSSYAEYETGTNLAMRESYRVMARRTEDDTIEVVGYTGGDSRRLAEVEAIVNSLTLGGNPE